MKGTNLGKGMVVGGVVGSVLCVMAEILIYSNRLREIEAQSFGVVGSDKMRTVTVGVSNWLPLFILVIFILAICLFLISIGFRLMKKESRD